MALIWRGIFEVADASFPDSASSSLQAWLRGKLRDTALVVPADGRLLRLDGGHEVTSSTAREGELIVFRGSLYEPRADEELRTTLTVLGEPDTTWAWIDLERWSSAAFVEPWTPIAPGLVSSLLRERSCKHGNAELSDRPRFLRGAQGRRFAEQLLDASRTLPFVVVTRGRNDRASDVEQRAIQIQRRLAGIAPVTVLGEGAVSSFSQVMTNELGPGHDVYLGAVRTYLPGPVDSHSRAAHRLVPFHRIEGRPAPVVADLIASPIQRGACAQAPPAIWRDQLRDLLEPTRMSDDEIQEELERLERERDQERNMRMRLEETLESERETAGETERENDALRRRVAWQRTRLRESGTQIEEPVPKQDDIDPDFCGDVPIAAAGLPHIAYPEEQWPLADDLDAHLSSAWAKRAWRAFRAMSAYGSAKASGRFAGNFWDYCADGHEEAIPTSWIAMAESETTDNNERFRTLRVLPVAAEVTPDRTIYMPAHIKVERGGYPAPRIHFHDDTGGETAKVHIGYFGEHLDNKSKS